MSGLLNEAVTPCPPRLSNGNDTLDTLLRAEPDPFDDTANLEFTTEIRAPALTKAKPKRRTRAPSSFQIRGDENDEATSAPSINKRRRENGVPVSIEAASSRKPSSSSSSLLAQPAQRFRPKASFAPSPAESTNTHRPRESEIKPRRENPRPSMATNNDLLMQVTGKERDVQKDVLKKDVRRETVYIPTDDTTVASVFMGMFSPLKSQALRNVDGQTPKNTEIGSLEARIVEKRQAKKSLAGSARRAPLQPSTKIAQEASIRVDVAGKNGGKENTPPGSRFVENTGKGYKRDRPSFEQPKIRLAGSAAKPGTIRSNVQTPNASNKPRAVQPVNKPPQRTVLGDKGNAKSTTANTIQKKSGAIKPKQEHGEQDLPRTRKPVLPKPVNHPTTNVVSSKAVLSTVKTKKLNQQFPLLTEDISKPALYEENWLLHQEILITQLLNGLFEQTDGQTECDDPATLRHELLDYYQDDSFALLYKRVQASLLYGTMSIPKDVLTRAAQLKQDLGLKQRFLDIWTQTYDPSALRAALETVVGRRVFQEDDESRSYTTTASKKKALNKRLGGFLEMFLLRNEDMSQPQTQAQKMSMSAHAYRRTVLRSIMIVALLDKARVYAGTMTTTTLPRCLFLASSPMKSSATVLRALARLLLPSSGDIVKSLSQLDCQVAYEQHQLEEYDYHIDNLAVDIRDGVRLTRVVELLLYSQDPEHTAKVMEPDEGSLLTPHLKLPCASRAVKLFNVQIALNALGNGTNGTVHNVAAEDIVDGHREKTLALLWRLVSKWGLPGLVDWDDVRQEITRLQRRAVAQFGHEDAANGDWRIAGTTESVQQQRDEYTTLLHQWASLLAGLKGLRLNNFSTSFADSRVYESIVEEYQHYILGSVESGGNLASRLQALGCSSEFGMFLVAASWLFCSVLFISTNQTTARVTSTPLPYITSSDFTFGALAFLCSRLLSASKRARAATIVQRAWRDVLVQRNTHCRSVASVLARQCAAVVETRDQVVWAKDVIVRRWRRQRQQQQQQLRGHYK